MPGMAFGTGDPAAPECGTAAYCCDNPQDLITQLLRRLEQSVKKDQPPNPSILLAMNLAGATKSATCQWLLQQIEEEAVEKAQDMSTGRVALDVLALLSSGKDPQQVHTMGRTVNLVLVLQQKVQQDLATLEEGIQKISLLELSLGTLALCLMRAGGYEGASRALARKVLNPQSQMVVETRAMVAMAMACAYNRTDIGNLKERLQEALSTVTNGFLDEQEKKGGMIGNVDNMGLAMQALQVTKKFYAPREWNCAQAFAVVLRHDYREITALARVLPILVGKTYLDAASRGGTNIKVNYSITNQLQEKYFNCSISVSVPAGSTLLKVLQVAQEKEPETFSFKLKATPWGPMVISIHGLASTDDKTYWQFFSGQKALHDGVDTYKPQDGENIKAIFSSSSY